MCANTWVEWVVVVFYSVLAVWLLLLLAKQKKNVKVKNLLLGKISGKVPVFLKILGPSGFFSDRNSTSVIPGKEFYWQKHGL